MIGNDDDNDGDGDGTAFCRHDAHTRFLDTDTIYQSAIDCATPIFAIAAR